MADQLCVEYHHHREGMQEVYIIGTDGQGIAFDAQHIHSVVGILTGFIKADIPEGKVVYMTIDDRGGVRYEEGVQV